MGRKFDFLPLLCHFDKYQAYECSADITNFSRLGTELVYIAASIQLLITGSETAEKVTRLVVRRGLPLECGSVILCPHYVNGRKIIEHENT